MTLTLVETVPLSKYQGAYEVTPGTLLAAKRKVYFMDGELKEYVDTTYPQERRASFEANYRSFPTKHYSEITGVTAAPTYEDIGWLLGLFAAGTTTPVPTNVTGQRQTFRPNPTTENLKTATLELGGGTTPYAVPFILGNRLELGWSKNSPMTASMDFLGGIPVQQAFTSNLSDRTTEDINGALATAYIDTTTIGSTAVTSVLEAKITLDNHWNQFYSLNGSLGPSDAYRGETRYADLAATLAFDTAAEYALFQSTTSNTYRKIRIKVLGSVIAGASSSLQKSLTFDWYGDWETAEFGTQDGLRVVNFKGRSIVDSTALYSWQAIVDSDVNAATVASTY